MERETTSNIHTYGPAYRWDSDAGWIYLHIEGKPRDRGLQHGSLLAEELSTILRSSKYLTHWNTGMPWSFFVQEAEKIFVPFIDEEYLEEIRGIAEGAQRAGVDVTWEEILAWNGYEELTDYWWPNVKAGKYAQSDPKAKDHCSAFVALVPETDGPRIVMAHNSWTGFEMGQFCNLILDIQPEAGHRIFMQSTPGYIDSFTDFFVTDAGIMGTETTIGGFSLYDPNEAPEFFRARKAMQYANDLDHFVDLMRKQNNGGYANSWLLAEIGSLEIMRFELGLKYFNVERTGDPGRYFVGFNAPLDPRIRNLECANTGYADLRRHQGARQVMLDELVKEHLCKTPPLDVDAAKQIIADHRDAYLEQKDNSRPVINPCSRTVCGHYELDPREYMSQPGRPLPFQPRGAIDGKVMDSHLARDLSFWARWGSSCGRPFIAKDFLAKHPQWMHLNDYLFDRPSQTWELFKAGQEDVPRE